MHKAVTSGKFPDERSWCRAVLLSGRKDIPEQWRIFALAHLQQTMAVANASETNQNGLQWAINLRDKEQAGHRLCHAQMDAWRAAFKRSGLLMNGTPGHNEEGETGPCAEEKPVR